jgi:hypothetical protein
MEAARRPEVELPETLADSVRARTFFASER